MLNSLLIAQGHVHESLDLGVGIGPLVLRVAVLAAVPVVAGFALLRGFLAEPGRLTSVAVVATAGGAATLELLLAGALNLPRQVVPLLLAALAVPLYLILSRDERFAPAVGRVRRLAPLVFWPVAVLAAVQLGLALFGAAGSARTATLLHTGVLLGLVALVWFVVARPLGAGVTLGLRVGAALLATGLVGGVAQAIVLAPAKPVPGVATSARVELGRSTVDALVVPNLPGWNLVHVGADGAAVGTSRAELAKALPRPNTTGGWVAVKLPAGPSELWVRRGSRLGSFTTDTGAENSAAATFTGPDGPECVSALLGRMLASGTATGVDCPSDALNPLDADTLRDAVALLAGDGHRRISVIADDSPRGEAADSVVRAAAAERGMKILRSGDRRIPLVVVSGWAGTHVVLRRVADGDLPADGTYLAPWLFTERPTVDVGQRIAQRFDPADEPFRRYVAELRDDYPAQLPSAGGYREWLAERLERETGAVRLSRPRDGW